MVHLSFVLLGSLSLHVFLPIFSPPPRSPLFPYTTLFRSFLRKLADLGARDRYRPYQDRARAQVERSEEHTSELQSHVNLVCRLLLEKKKKISLKHVLLAHHVCTLDSAS